MAGIGIIFQMNNKVPTKGAWCTFFKKYNISWEDVLFFNVRILPSTHHFLGDFAEPWPNISQNRCFPAWNGTKPPHGLSFKRGKLCFFLRKEARWSSGLFLSFIGSTVNGTSKRSMEAIGLRSFASVSSSLEARVGDLVPRPDWNHPVFCCFLFWPVLPVIYRHCLPVSDSIRFQAWSFHLELLICLNHLFSKFQKQKHLDSVPKTCTDITWKGFSPEKVFEAKFGLRVGLFSPAFVNPRYS